MVQIQPVAFTLLLCESGWTFTAVLHRSHCGMVTGLEASRGKGLEPAFRLTVVVAHDLLVLHQLQVMTVLFHKKLKLTKASPGKVVPCAVVCSCTALGWGTGWFRSNPAFLEVRNNGFTQVSPLMWITVPWHGCSWHGSGEKTVSAAVLGYADINGTALIKIRSTLNSIKFRQKWGMLLMRLLQNSHVSGSADWLEFKGHHEKPEGWSGLFEQSANLKCRPRAVFNSGFLGVVSQEAIT